MKKELAQEITDKFTAQLREGVTPWRKPWSVSGFGHHNYFSRRPYRGINTLILAITAQMCGYNSPAWTTYKKAAEHGAQVRKGEKGTPIIFWKTVDVEDKADPDKTKKIPMARTYYVFNTDQIDGIEWSAPDREPVEIRDALKQVVDNYPNPPRIEHAAGDSAHYTPATDVITLPLLEQFHDEKAFAETVLHECVHSTGHTSRLGRFIDNRVGCRGAYAKEELIAEIGASMLMQHVGIEPDMPQMASYVQGWLKALEDDETLIIKAAQAAQKAMDHILGATFQEEQ
jgi:antirestriction protein ArdC